MVNKFSLFPWQIAVLTLSLASARASVTVSSPTNGVTLASPVHVAASAPASSVKMAVSVDKKIAYTTTGATLNTYLPLSGGVHVITVLAWQQSGNIETNTVVTKVSTSSTSPLQVAQASLPSGVAGTSYSAALYASGGTLPYNWSIASGLLPTGLSLSNSGAITGTPEASGTHSFTAQVKDDAGAIATSSESITVSAPATPITITTSSLPSAVVGNAYSTALSASGATLPYTWSLVEGMLPPGVTVSSTGAVTGKPSTAGTYTFAVQVEGSAGLSQAATASESITVAPNSSQPTPPPQAAGYTLKFSDDFSTGSLGSKGAAYNWYNISAVSNSVSVSNSVLNLNVPLPNSGYSSAVASNAGWQFGYVEIRAQWMAGTKGSWPALWMIPIGSNATYGAAGSYTNGGGEIDILEGNGGFQPNQYWGTVHYWVNNTDTWNNEAKSANVYTAPAGVDLTQYHTYGVMWKPGAITWYFDNQPVVSTTGYPSGIDATSYYLMLGQQVGINAQYGNTTGVTASNIGMNVDWVHVWQQ